MERNQVVSESFVESNMVPAVIEIWARHRLHWKRSLLFKRQYFVWPHDGQTKPCGHRQWTRALRHWSSDPNWDRKPCKLRPCWNWILFLHMVAPSYIRLGSSLPWQGYHRVSPLEKIWLSFISNQIWILLDVKYRKEKINTDQFTLWMMNGRLNCDRIYRIFKKDTKTSIK